MIKINITGRLELISPPLHQTGEKDSIWTEDIIESLQMTMLNPQRDLLIAIGYVIKRYVANGWTFSLFLDCLIKHILDQDTAEEKELSPLCIIIQKTNLLI